MVNDIFSKTTAVNNAVAESHGDIIVILDADCYIDSTAILSCAEQIRSHRKKGYRLWFMPYRYSYRLSDKTSRGVIDSDPFSPPDLFNSLISADMIDIGDVTYTGVIARGGNAHWFGALVQVMPREAFFAAGAMDERFIGWGGEDISFMHAVDTLYGKHKTISGKVFHLWHPNNGTSVKNRTWDGQAGANSNGWLAWRYSGANGDYGRMLNLVNEHQNPVSQRRWRKRC